MTTRTVATLVLLAAFATSTLGRQTPRFVDRTTALGLAPGNDQACWVDIDNDRWPDLVASGGIWRNRDGRRFERIGDSGLAVAADFDNDGFADLFSWSNLTLQRNAGGKRFVSFPLPKLPETVSRGACWTDFDRDGWVDLVIGGYEDWDRGITWPTLFLRNENGKSFALVKTDTRFRARGISACDFDRDGFPEIYQSNYRLQPNVLWKRTPEGGWTDAAPATGAVATSPGFDGGHSIGAAWGDFDNDGWIDLFAGNFAHVDSRGDQPKSRFLRNVAGEGTARKFEDKGTCGVFYQESYASPAVGDIDNDGRLDLFFTTVYGTASFGRPNNPVLFHNDGGFAFADGPAAAGLAGLPPTYQAAFADFDRDGDLDLVSGGRLFVNTGPRGHWLAVRLRGDGTAVNRSAIGAQVWVRSGDRTWVRQVEAGTGEGNQNDTTLHFGLGDATGTVDVRIQWPDGRTRDYAGIGVDRLLEATAGR
ncbi:MAG: CRTAC1 family protein [Armatimonadota bacterium]